MPKIPPHKIQEYVKDRDLLELVKVYNYLRPRVFNMDWSTDFDEYEKDQKRMEFIEECIRFKKGGEQQGRLL